MDRRRAMDRRQLLRGTGALAVTAALPRDAGRGAETLGEPKPLDGRPLPAYDYSRANKLPKEMTGYWTKSFDVGGRTRTAKVYISAGTPIRSYYTVIAGPDGAAAGGVLR